jgi:alkylation response protein AidB-like acyl-CoA dehydrogenase
MSTAGFERGVVLRSPGRFTATADRLIALFKERGSPESLQNDVVRAWMEADAYRLATFWAVSKLTQGGTIGAEASLNKLWWSEMDLHMHETAMRLLGEDATIDGAWLDGFVFSLAGPIYAGTNEIQRNIVAERVLGLPRS